MIWSIKSLNKFSFELTAAGKRPSSRRGLGEELDALVVLIWPY